MKFRLVYEGKLPSSSKKGDKNEVKQDIRRYFHSQLSILWKQRPLNQILVTDEHERGVLKKIKNFTFKPLVCDYVKTVAELDIVFLRPEEPGSIFSQSGDIDNRIKTLIDGLRIPKENEIPQSDIPEKGENPFFCLLEDDKLITHLSVTTDRLLKHKNHQDVFLMINVNILSTERTWLSMFFQ